MVSITEVGGIKMIAPGTVGVGNVVVIPGAAVVLGGVVVLGSGVVVIGDTVLVDGVSVVVDVEGSGSTCAKVVSADA